MPERLVRFTQSFFDRLDDLLESLVATTSLRRLLSV